MGKTFSSERNDGLILKKGLEPADLLQIQSLEHVCNEYENLKMQLKWSILHNRPANQLNDFLYFADGQLVGYLALFVFSSFEAEVSGMVHPDYRRKGIFTGLLNAAKVECIERNIPKILFICENSSSSAKGFIEYLGAVYSFSEFKMDYMNSGTLEFAAGDVSLRKVKFEDAPMRAEITSICFDIPVENLMDRFTSESYKNDNPLYMVEACGKNVGKIDGAIADEEVIIYGFGILPEYRKRGYGRQALTLFVNELLKEKPAKISLEVECENVNALNLYKSCGFAEVTSYDYYRIALK